MESIKHIVKSLMALTISYIKAKARKRYPPSVSHFYFFVFPSLAMGRKKLQMKRIENASNRQATYVNRKESLVKKASELSLLCDTDIAFIMFPSNGEVTSFANNGRVEDVFLRFLDRPDELKGGYISNQAFLSEKLKQLKYEREMLEKIEIIEDLEEKLDKLNRKRNEAHEKMRYYKPDVEKISSAYEAGVAQQYLTSALERIQLSKTELHGKQLADPQRNRNKEKYIVHEEDTSSVIGEASHMNQNRMNSMGDGDHLLGASLPPIGSQHLNLEFIEAFNHINQQ